MKTSILDHIKIMMVMFETIQDTADTVSLQLKSKIAVSLILSLITQVAIQIMMRGSNLSMNHK